MEAGGRAMNWKEKTCKGCCFRVGVVCRRFPPVVQNEYPYVTRIEPGLRYSYLDACSEYAELLQPTITIKGAVS